MTMVNREHKEEFLIGANSERHKNENIVNTVKQTCCAQTSGGSDAVWALIKHNQPTPARTEQVHSRRPDEYFLQ